MTLADANDSLSQATTEQRNASSQDIDRKTTLEIVTIINSEDQKVAPAIQKILPEIAALVDDIVVAFKNNGRLIYIGAGTSGRLGVLDASECPPTYGVDPSMVQGLIAGGNDALTRSIESAEDRAEAGVADLKGISFTAADVLVGITASGSALYVLGALNYAAGIGAVTAAISCNASSKTFAIARHQLYADVGPEVVTGSTRMKSGTAQKLILNTLSTASMIRVGKVYKNLMVDLRPVNQKLVQRSLRLIREVTGCSEDIAVCALAAANKAPKTAIVMVLCGVDCATAERLLTAADGYIGGVKQVQ
ncbi:MAG: N-acetylmuramic acid 6-phosphate etherase [Treponema sp.]|jgi:N-acetylmuramic acid 6-phosphate etherase|nr:N-acetylmuramic acid 6-phosphate etherase [Treponema sp.]